MPERSFASDNHSGAHPRVMEALLASNAGDAPAYGEDIWTVRGIQAIKAHLGEDCDVHFVLLGTAANVLSLQTLLNPWDAIIAPATAHISTDECGAPQAHVRCIAHRVPSEDGKLTTEMVRPFLQDLGFVHHSQPRVLSISNTTEVGTVYTPEEIRTLADFAHNHGLLLHLDGARIANACVSLGCGLAEITRDAGVDVLSLGGTKNGMAFGEAVVFFKPELAANFPYIRKQGMQLLSKMRYIGAQFSAMFGTDLWKENAMNANAMARRLAERVSGIPGIDLLYPVEGNALFALIPDSIIEPLQERFPFYVLNPDAEETRSLVRWMCAFDFTEAQVDEFAEAVDRLCRA